MSVAVIAMPGENGHIELRVGPVDPLDTVVGVVAVRHESVAGPTAPRYGAGGQLTAIVPPGHRYGLATVTVQGYCTPEFVMTTFLTETRL